jgi:hypothetical protein
MTGFYDLKTNYQYIVMTLTWRIGMLLVKVLQEIDHYYNYSSKSGLISLFIAQIRDSSNGILKVLNLSNIDRFNTMERLKFVLKYKIFYYSKCD